KLKIPKVGIVGLGGTGAYILDQAAKTPAWEIHLFDGDRFSPHNAFRAPGAPSFEELRAEPQKVDYFHGIYSRMRSGIIPHNEYIDESNVDQLGEMSFVFLAFDRGSAKKLLVARLSEFGVPFVDVGMGVYEVD